MINVFGGRRTEHCFSFFWCGIVSEVGPGCSPKDFVSVPRMKNLTC